MEDILRHLLEIEKKKREERVFNEARSFGSFAVKAPIELPSDSPKLHLWLAPVDHHLKKTKYNVNKIRYDLLRPLNCREWSRFYNFAGLYTKCATGKATYVQFHRDGIIEAVDATFLSKEDKSIPCEPLKNLVEASLQDYLAFYQALHPELPIFLRLGFDSIPGFVLSIHGEPSTFKTPPELWSFFIPMVQIDDLQTPADKILKPCLDILCNTFGYPEYAP